MLLTLYRVLPEGLIKEEILYLSWILQKRASCEF